MPALMAGLFGLVFLLTSSAGFGQALQWSQFTGQNPSGNQNSQAGAYAVKVATDGSIYVLGQGIAGTLSPLGFPTSDIALLGSYSTSVFTTLQKYSADGTTLQWVRILSNAGSTNRAAGMELSPSGDLIVLTQVTAANPALITANAWQPNPPDFTQTPASAKALVLNRFDTSGNMTYGTYIGPTGGSLNIPSKIIEDVTTPDIIDVGADGTIYLAFNIAAATGQTGIMPTTANAFRTGLVAGATASQMVMIFNSNNSLRYSSYMGDDQNTLYDHVVAPNGDVYISFQVSGTLAAAPYLPALATNAAFTSYSQKRGAYLLRLDANGTVLGNTFGGNAYTLALTASGNVMTVDGTNATSQLRVFNSSLTSLVAEESPFGTGFNNSSSDIAIDAQNRVHVLSIGFTANVANPTTPGGLITTNSLINANYSIIDRDYSTLVYATNLSTYSGRSFFNDLEVVGCNTYIAGRIQGAASTPVTYTAYNDAGTGTLSGYDVTPTASTTSANGVLMKFNYPVIQNTNTITTPSITSFCAGSGVLPIDGTKVIYKTPEVIGQASGNPAPYPIHYKWQVAPSATGPWTDLADSDVEDYLPKAPATAGTFCYRRLARQTPYIPGIAVPSCDTLPPSNSVCLTFSASKTHATRIPSGKYGLCQGSTLPVSVSLVPGADGNQGPYSYKLTTLSNLTAITLGQSGTVASAPGTINLNINTAGDYMLQVTDSRGCISFDTLKVENLALNAGSSTVFTCGASTVTLGPVSSPPDYLNFTTNTLSWSSTAGLNDPNSSSPIFTHGLAVGDSTTKYLTFNGCLVDQVTIKNISVTPLAALPSLSVCQGTPVLLGAELGAAQTGVTYEWAPGLGLKSTNAINTTLVTNSAPLGVNVTTYTVKAQNGSTGCAQYATRQVTVYRTPNQSFQINDCMRNGCNPSVPLSASGIGTVSELGISYSWTAVIQTPASTTSGVPSVANVLSGLSNPTGATTDFAFATPSLGRASGTYTILLIRTSYNTANPACSRTDTAFYDYCSCGSGLACQLAQGGVPINTCGGPTNIIGPKQYSSGGTYVWSRLDGKPLNNELFDPYTNQPLVVGGAHPNQVIANPTGLTAVSYRLTLYQIGGDTCRIDIKVNPGAAGKPTVNYTSPQTVCQGTSFTITGPTATPGLVYDWEPNLAFLTLADTAKALPAVKALNVGTSVYVTVTDPSTGCFVKDTVSFLVSPIDVKAGLDGTFCNAGATIPVGAVGKAGYTYQWTALPSAGVTFANSTSAQTMVTLPASTTGQIIKLILTASNGSCTRSDTVAYTATGNPTITIQAPDKLCAGGNVLIGPITPSGSSYTYAWTGPGIVGSSTSSQITVNAIGTYTVTVGQGTCSSVKTVAVSAVTALSVTPSPTSAPCASAATIGVSNTAAAGFGWTYEWSTLAGLTANASDLSTISVYPTTTTSYTLTATHVSGCSLTFPFTVPGAAYQADLPAVLNVCEGQSVTLPLNSPAAVSGTVVWTASSTAARLALSSTTAINPTLNLASLARGSYSYTATVSYGTACTSIATMVVNVGKKIDNIAGLDAEVCQGSCVTIGTSTIAGVLYSWSSTPADPAFVSTRIAQPKVCPTQTTTYTLNYTDESGCSFTDDVTVKATQAIPTLGVQNLDVCQNATGTLMVSLPSAITANTGTTTSYWLNPSASVSSLSTVSAAGTYYIKTTSANGFCSTIQPVTVTINELPTGTLDAFYSCNTLKGVLQVNGVTTGARYDYSTGGTYTGAKTFATASVIGGGGILASNLPTPPVAGQQYTVRLFGSDGSCYQDITTTLLNTCPVACTLAVTAQPGACVAATNSYSVSGTISLTSATAGIATITDGTKSATVTVATSTTAIPYSLTGLTSGTGSHTVTVSLPGCGTTTTTYTAPASCSVALTVIVSSPICNSLTNTYTATATVSLTNATAGTLAVTRNGTSLTTITVTAGQTTASFTLTGLSGSSPASNTLIVQLATATASTTYATPASCTVCSTSLTTTSLAPGQIGLAYSQSLTASGGTTPYTYTLLGALPNGLSLSSSGVISGTPTSATTTSFTVKVSDARSCSASQTLSITTGNAPVCSLTATATPGSCNTATNTYTVTGTVSATNSSSTQSLTVSVGSISTVVSLTNNGPVSYTLTGLPSDGLTKTLSVVSSATACGQTSLTYSAPASCSVALPSLTVIVSSPICNSLTNTYTATATVSLTNATAGTLAVTRNGTSLTTITVTAGQTTASFTLTGLSGSSPASNTLIVQLATATASTTYATPASCTVCSTSLTTTSLAPGQIGLAYSQSLTASGGTTPYTYTLLGALPNGLSLSSSGVISGTPTSATTTSFTVKVSDARSCSASQTLSITTSNAPVCSLTATATPGSCNTATNTYTLTGTVSLTNNTTGGQVVITDGLRSTTLTLASTATSLPFALTGLVSDGLRHTLQVTLAGCGTTTTIYSAPQSCSLAPSLTLEKRVNLSKAKLGDVLTYTLVLTNVGSAAASNVVVTDSSTAGLNYVTGSATTPTGTTFVQGAPLSTWRVGSLSAGQSVSLTFQAKADSSGILYNKATIPGDTAIVCTTIPVKVCAGEAYSFQLAVAPGRSSYRWYRNGEELIGQTTNSLDVSSPGSYSLSVDNVSGKCPDFSCCPFIIEEDSLPSFQARARPVTCLGNTLQANGQILLSRFPPAATYQYSLGSSFNEAASLSGPAKAIPASGVLVNTLSNPAVAQAYTVRVYNASGCYTDETVMLLPTVCGCPQDVCTPFVLKQTKRAKRVGEAQ